MAMQRFPSVFECLGMAMARRQSIQLWTLGLKPNLCGFGLDLKLD